MRFLLFLLPATLFGQIQPPIFDEVYNGPPHEVYEGSRATSPGHVYRIAFCTMNVPDSLYVIMCGESYSFYIGDGPDHPGCLEGPLQMELNMQDKTFDTISQFYPVDWETYGPICWEDGGFLLVDFVIPEDCCLLEWRMAGNATAWTRFSMRMWEWKLGGWSPGDTVQSYSCIGAYEEYQGTGCDGILWQYADSSINVTHEVFLPECGENGSIVFSDYPELDTFGIGPGEYSFELSNSVCSESITIHVPDDYICSVYTPNIFKPDLDGQNDVWFIGADKDMDYELWVYDRWGGLVFHGDCVLNQTGWDGDGAQEGVYVFKAIIKDLNQKLFYGDITLIR